MLTLFVSLLLEFDYLCEEAAALLELDPESPEFMKLYELLTDRVRLRSKSIVFSFSKLREHIQHEHQDDVGDRIKLLELLFASLLERLFLVLANRVGSDSRKSLASLLKLGVDKELAGDISGYIAALSR